MEALLAQREALVIARASGQLELEFYSGGTRRRVTYRSLAEIERSIAAIDRDIAAINGRRVTTFLPSFKTGFSE